MAKKSELILMDTKQITGADIDRLYEKLTGKKPTADESALGERTAAEMRTMTPLPDDESPE